MRHLPQCWSQKKHDAHTWGHYEPDERAPFDCPGLDHGVRFIDNFHKKWNCVAGAPCWKYINEQEARDEYPEHLAPHEKCGYVWTAELTPDDMDRLGWAFDMSREDIKEFLSE